MFYFETAIHSITQAKVGELPFEPLEEPTPLTQKLAQLDFCPKCKQSRKISYMLQVNKFHTSELL